MVFVLIIIQYIAVFLLKVKIIQIPIHSQTYVVCATSRVLNRFQDNRCCIFSPAFGCCAHMKAGQNTFFSRYQTCLFFSTFFNEFLSEIKKKCLEKLCFKMNLRYPPGSRPAFACQPASRSSLKNIFFNIFKPFFLDLRWKFVEKH